jgi:hypothetical protein
VLEIGTSPDAECRASEDDTFKDGSLDDTLLSAIGAAKYGKRLDKMS